MDHRIVNRAIPVGRLLRRGFIGPDHSRRKSQLLLQGWTHLLVCFQAPAFPYRTAPMFIGGVLAVADLQFHLSDDAPERHHPLSPMVSLSVAEGEKPRLGGWLLPAAFALIVGASTRALLLKLPVQCPAMSGLYYSPKSSVLFLSFDGFNWMRNQCSVSLDEEPITTLHYRGCVKMLTVGLGYDNLID